MPRREVNTEIEIDAPPERVWQTLGDLTSWSEWNPVIPAIATAPREGATVRFTIRLGGPRLGLTARLQRWAPGEELRWRGPPQAALGVLFSGEHFMRLHALDGDRTRFEHGETFDGWLVPLAWWRLRAVLPGAYAAMNRALKERVEG